MELTTISLVRRAPATRVEVVVPTDITLGRHTLVAWALVDGQVQVSGLAVGVVGLLPPGALPATGGSPLRTTSIAFVLLLLGIAIVGSTRRRLHR